MTSVVCHVVAASHATGSLHPGGAGAFAPLWGLFCVSCLGAGGQLGDFMFPLSQLFPALYTRGLLRVSLEGESILLLFLSSCPHLAMDSCPCTSVLGSGSRQAQ